MKKYNGIDLFKIIAAYLIILLHVSIFESETIGYIIVRQIITIVAVPFFFAASGFLISNKLDKQAIPKSVKVNYKKYLLWSVIYLPFAVFGWFVSGLPLYKSLLYYVRDFIFEGSYLTIWFLNALAFAIVIEWLLLKRFSKKMCFYISIPFFIIACLLSSYNQLFTEIFGSKLSDVYYLIFSSTKNGVLFGFPFVALGAYIATISKQKHENKKVSVLGMVISFVLLIIEVLIRNSYFPQNKSVDFAIMLVPFTAFALMLSSSLDLKESETHKGIYSYLRTLSVLLFLTQRIFIFGFDVLDKVIARLTGQYIISAVPAIEFLLVACGTTLFSMFVIRLSSRIEWLKKLY